MAEYIPYKKPQIISDYTQFQLDELARCAEDPIYFIKNYWKVNHPTLGTLPFELYDFQEKAIMAIHTHRFVVGNWGRQSGKTSCAAAYIAWKTQFTPDVTILLTSLKLSGAIEIMDRVKFGYEELPDWLRAGATEYNKQKVTFDNKSKIVARATTKDAGRGLSISMLFIDEMAFIPNTIQKEFMGAVTATISTGGSLLVFSTPRTDIDEFAKLWKGANDTTDEYGNELPDGIGKNGYYATKAIWSDVPGRTEEWAAPFREQLGDARFAQEFEGSFLTDEELLIDSTFLSTIKTSLPEYYTEDGKVRWFKDPEPNKTYLIGFDPSAGTGGKGDAAAIQVYAISDGVMEQVAEFQHNKSLQKIQVRVLLRIMQNVYDTLRSNPEQDGEPEIFWTFEANGLGEGITNMVIENEEMFYGQIVNEKRKSGLSGKRSRRGLWTDTRRKMNVCIKLKSLIETGKLIFHSEGMLREMKSFIRTGDRFAAKPGDHDDLISATLLCIRMLDSVINMSEAASAMKESIEDDDVEPMPFAM